MLAFESKLNEYVADLKIKRLTKQVYEAIDRLEKLPRLVEELKKQ